MNCSATAARKIAAHFTPEVLAPYPNVDGVCAFVHGTGCGMAGVGDGFEALQRVMWGYARHPNYAGVVMVGLGCEMNQIDWLLEAHGIQKGPLFDAMNIQNVAGLRRTVEVGIERVTDMLPLANEFKREPCPASEIKLALQCGGSDAWSGITANPALGFASDLLVAQGAATVLAETPEIYGAEHLLTRRAVDRATGDKLVAPDRVVGGLHRPQQGFDGQQPQPRQQAGRADDDPGEVARRRGQGRHLAADGRLQVRRAGDEARLRLHGQPRLRPGQRHRPDRLRLQHGLLHDRARQRLRLQARADDQDRDELRARPAMPEDMDIDAGRILTGEATLEEVGREIYAKVLAVASGERSFSEAQGLGDYEFVPWQIGAVM